MSIRNWTGKWIATPIRRPLLIALAAVGMSLHCLPGPVPMQRVELQDERGNVQQCFLLGVHDPTVDVLRTRILAAHAPDYRKRTAEYYRTKLVLDVAEFYAGGRQAVATKSKITRASIASPNVVTAGYEEVDTHESALSEGTDWDSYWVNKRDRLRAKLASLEPKSSMPEVYRRLKIADIVDSGRPLPSLFTSFLISGVACGLTYLFACQPRRRRILYYSKNPIEIPGDWVTIRRSWRETVREWTAGQWFEGAAIVVLVGICV